MAPRSTSDRDGEDDSPLDKTQMAAIWSVGNSPVGLFFFVVRTGLYVPRTACVFRFNQLTQGIYITLPYTLAVYMVRHFEGDSGTEESIGRNTGLLVSIRPLTCAQYTSCSASDNKTKANCSCSIQTCLCAHLSALLLSA